MIKIKNYNIYEKETEIMIEVAMPQVKNFNFLNSYVYISEKWIKKNVILIHSKEDNSTIVIEKIKKEQINKIRDLKFLKIALLKDRNTHSNAYILDLLEK